MIYYFNHTLNGSADKIFYNSTQVYPQVLIESKFNSDTREYAITRIQLRTHTDFNGYTTRKYFFSLPYDIKLNIPGKKTYTFTGDFIGSKEVTYNEGSVGGWTPYELVSDEDIILTAEAYNEVFPKITVSISIERDYTSSSGKEYHYSSIGSNIMFLPTLAKTPEVTRIDIINNPDKDKVFVNNLLLSIDGEGVNITPNTYAHIRIYDVNTTIVDAKLNTDTNKFYTSSSDLLSKSGQYNVDITLKNQTTYDNRTTKLTYSNVLLEKPNVSISQSYSGKFRIVRISNDNEFEVQLHKQSTGDYVLIAPNEFVDEEIDDTSVTTFAYYTSIYNSYSNTLFTLISNASTTIDLIPAMHLSLGSIDYSGNYLELKDFTSIGLSKDTVFTLKLNDNEINYKLLSGQPNYNDLNWSNINVWVKIPDNIYFVDNAPNISKANLSATIGSTLLEAQVDNLNIPLNSNSYIYLNGSYKLGNLLVYNNGKFVTGNMKVLIGGESNE